MKKTVKEVTSSFFQHGLFHNLSLTHYSGPGPDDLLFLQVKKTGKENQAMGSLGVVWERREAGECARCNERPKVCASLPSKSNHRQGSNKQKCGYHLRFSNLSKSDFSPIKNRPPIIYVWNFVCQGQKRATSFTAFVVSFSMSK